jgi:hypothetical protein
MAAIHMRNPGMIREKDKKKEATYTLSALVHFHMTK